METEQGAATVGRPPGGIDALVEAQILLAAGIDLQRAGRGREAIEAYGRAIAVQPDLVEAYHNLGVALRAAGCTPASVACFRRALRLRPGQSQMLCRCASCRALRLRLCPQQIQPTIGRQQSWRRRGHAVVHEAATGQPMWPIVVHVCDNY